ncbi:MAG: hypothetical protein QGH63_02365 [Rhodospirillales bacterium]|nr:hypothetical protein [Rhodospirillales bacterium]
MNLMNSELYDALLDAGASESKAQTAVVSMADYDRQFAKTNADLPIIKWMVGFNLAFSVAMIMQHMFM